MPKIHPGSAFDLAGYQLKGEYNFKAVPTAVASAQATARREQMLQSTDPVVRRVAEGTLPGMGTPKPMHLVRPARKKTQGGA